MKHVMIVDDSKPIRERLVSMLDESAQVDIVGQTGNGAEALGAIERLKPDTVILDIRLPGSSGITLLREIKTRHPEMTVIMLTNFDGPQYRRQCMRMGADHFLNKTLEFEKIVDTITLNQARGKDSYGVYSRKESFMETFKNILVVSRSTQHCVKVLKAGISMARKYGARLHVLHIIHDPFNLDGWNLPLPSFENEYKKMVATAREELDRLVATEKAEGLVIDEWIKNGDPVDEIQRIVESANVDLILILAHKEGRLEHFLFGKTNEAIIRSLPATLMLIK